jgi:hypothetical protein
MKSSFRGSEYVEEDNQDEFDTSFADKAEMALAQGKNKDGVTPTHQRKITFGGHELQNSTRRSAMLQDNSDGEMEIVDMPDQFEDPDNPELFESMGGRQTYIEN